MRPKKILLFAIGAASLALPAAAAAQQYDQPYARPYGGYDQPYGGGPRGDYDRSYGGRYGGFQGYPEFRGIENHIRQEIWQSVREDMIEPDDGRDLMNQLQQIRYQEQREFQVHGWQLPDDDRARIHERLDRLDHVVDQIRDEP